jgi:hypothetical protein
MKSFFSIDKFKELIVLFILEFIMFFLIALLIDINNYQVAYWDWKSFVLTMFTLLVSSAIDREKYWNLATFLSVGAFQYLIWWIIFHFSGIVK